MTDLNVGFTDPTIGDNLYGYFTNVKDKGGLLVELATNNLLGGFRIAPNLNSTASRNTLVGIETSVNLITGRDNTAIGYRTLWGNKFGNSNIAYGSNALENTTGNNNIGIGVNAGTINTTGEKNTFIGNIVSSFTNGNKALTNCTAVGYDAGTSNSYNEGFKTGAIQDIMIFGNNSTKTYGFSCPPTGSGNNVILDAVTDQLVRLFPSALTGIQMEQNIVMAAGKTSFLNAIQATSIDPNPTAEVNSATTWSLGKAARSLTTIDYGCPLGEVLANPSATPPVTYKPASSACFHQFNGAGVFGGGILVSKQLRAQGSGSLTIGSNTGIVQVLASDFVAINSSVGLRIGGAKKIYTIDGGDLIMPNINVANIRNTSIATQGNAGTTIPPGVIPYYGIDYGVFINGGMNGPGGYGSGVGINGINETTTTTTMVVNGITYTPPVNQAKGHGIFMNGKTVNNVGYGIFLNCDTTGGTNSGTCRINPNLSTDTINSLNNLPTPVDGSTNTLWYTKTDITPTATKATGANGGAFNTSGNGYNPAGQIYANYTINTLINSLSILGVNQTKSIDINLTCGAGNGSTAAHDANYGFREFGTAIKGDAESVGGGIYTSQECENYNVITSGDILSGIGYLVRTQNPSGLLNITGRKLKFRRTGNTSDSWVLTMFYPSPGADSRLTIFGVAGNVFVGSLLNFGSGTITTGTTGYVDITVGSTIKYFEMECIKGGNLTATWVISNSF